MYFNSQPVRNVVIAITISFLIMTELSDAQLKGGKNNIKGSVGAGKTGGLDKGFGSKQTNNGKAGNNPSKPIPGSGGTVSNKIKYANCTRSWDCCKPSCGWAGKAQVNKPVMTCAKDGLTKIDNNNQSICWQNGTSYLCKAYQPWTINDKLAYGYVAAGLFGQTESMWCCSCYELTITTTGLAKGKRLIVQAINSLADTDTNDFDVIIPGGGVGWNNYGCQNQYKAPTDGWGERYGGVKDQTGCKQLPLALQKGCEWRFMWFTKNINPVVSYRRIKCPTLLTAKSGCIRTDDNAYPAI